MADSKTLELQIRIAAQEAVRSVNSLKGEIQALASEAKKFAGEDGKVLEQSFREAEGAAKDAVTGIGGIKNAIMSLAEVAAAAKALSVIKDMGAFALQTADNFQTMKNQFGVLLGDMEAGAGLFSEIKAFNDVTPFDLDTLTQATNVLIAAKVPLKDLQAQLTKFGDLSQGNSQKLASYVNAFSQAAAKGKADMQVLNAYLHQGVPILDALAKNFSVTTAEIAEMASEGKIGFQDFSKALDDLAAAGGQYFGGMELASKSLAAMQEGLREAVNSLAASFGDMLLPAAAGVTGMLTGLTNAINESPILKGLFAGALTALAGYLSAMAVKAAVAFAAQMKLNLAVGALRPEVLAATLVVATLAAGYTILASDAQKAAKETESLSLAQRRQTAAVMESLTAVQEYYQNARNWDLAAALNQLSELQRAVAEQRQKGVVSSDEIYNLRTAIERFKQLRDTFIKDYYDSSANEKIQELQNRISVAQTYTVTVDISEGDRQKIQGIIKDAQDEINRLTADIILKSAEWRQTLQGVMNFSSEEIAGGALASGATAIDEYARRLQAAQEHALSFNGALGDEASALQNTAAQWERLLTAMAGSGQWEQSEASIQRVAAELERARDAAGQAGAAKTIEELRKKIEDFGKSESELAREAALANRALPEQAEEIARLTGEFQRKEIIADYRRQIEELSMSQKELALASFAATGATEEEMRAFEQMYDQLERLKAEAEAAAASWQQRLSESVALALADIEGFSGQASALIGDMAARLAEISLEGLLDGLREVGRAFATGEDAGKNFAQAMDDMAKRILDQLPMMFLQAGLQLIAQGQWPLGLALIAAAGSSAIISGYVDGETQRAREEAGRNAHGGVFGEYGHAAREFASGGAFTNQIVNFPTYFAHGGGLGLMGEAGPEAIMPLARLPNGDLGVQTAGGGANVVVNIINNSGAEVRQEETEAEGGGRQIDIVIGEMVNRHISSGKADRAMGRYGLRAAGV